MEPNFYTETATVLNADADFRSLLKPSALLRYVEQVSADHARAFGMDDKFFRDHNVAFLVGKQALQFVRVPRRTEALTLTTRAEHSRRVPSSASLRSRMPPGSWWPRWTAAGSWWIGPAATSCGNRTGPWKISGMRRWKGSCPCTPTVQRADVGRECRASYSLCDLNGHINNAYYLDLACDALPPEVLQAAR